MNNLNNIRIVLVNTSHPGNIGAAARAMKVMGLHQLYLVQPKQFPHKEAISMASGADDILENAIVTDTLEEALTATTFVVGTSARGRNLSARIVDARQGCEEITNEMTHNQVAILFGEERTGLTNEQLAMCHLYMTISCDVNYSSLNLAQAVQVIAYELRMASIGSHIVETICEEKLATNEEVEGFYQQLYDVMVETGFLDPNSPKRLMERLRRLFNRARLEQREVNILRGILTSTGEKH